MRVVRGDVGLGAPQGSARGVKEHRRSLCAPLSIFSAFEHVCIPGRVCVAPVGLVIKVCNYCCDRNESLGRWRIFSIARSNFPANICGCNVFNEFEDAENGLLNVSSVLLVGLSVGIVDGPVFWEEGSGNGVVLNERVIGDLQHLQDVCLVEGEGIVLWSEGKLEILS